MTPAETTFVAFAWLALGVVLSGAAVCVIYGLMRGAEAAVDLAYQIGRRLWARKKPCDGCAHTRFVYGPKLYGEVRDVS